MKYIIFSKNSGGVQIEKELREEGEDVLLVKKSDFQNTIKNIEDKTDYLIILDFQDNELYDELVEAGFEVKVELDDEIEEEVETINDVEKIKEEVEDDQYEVGFKKILSTVESLRKDIVDPNPIVKKTKEEINKTLDSLRGILADIEKKQDFDSHTLNNFKQSLSTLESKGKVTNDDLGRLSKGFDNLLNSFEKDKKELTNKISECSSAEDLAKTNKELATLIEDVTKIWIEIKKLFNLYGDRKHGDGYIVQGTTRLSLFLAGVSLNDVFNELNFVAGTNMTIMSSLDLINRRTNLTFNSTGGVLTETDPLSIHLDQTTPQTFTGGTVTGTGLLQVVGGVLGKNVMLTVSDTAPANPNIGDLWVDLT
jgi:ABC-type phosphate transport system auxiliary subunit